MTIDYEGPTEFSDHIYPAPDSITLSSIIYKDKKKIEMIGRKGLRYHAKFPDMENRQESRIFVLSGIVTGLCALLLKYFWRLMSDCYSIVKRILEKKPRVCKYINIIFFVIFAIILIWMLISALTISVDPYDMYNTLIE